MSRLFFVNVVPEFPVMLAVVMVTSMTIILMLTKLNLPRRYKKSVSV